MKLKTYGLIGMAAALLACVADVLLLYSPNRGYENMDYLFYRDIAQWRLTWGHFLGIFAIPFELVGFWQVYNALKPVGTKYTTPLMIATLFVMIIGVTYHGLCGAAGTFMHLGEEAFKDPAVFQATFMHIKTYFEPLGSVLFVVFLGISAGLFYLIKYKETHYAKQMLWFNPIFVYLFLIALYLIMPTIGGFFIVAGFNLSIFVVLAASIYYSRKEVK